MSWEIIDMKPVRGESLTPPVRVIMTVTPNGAIKMAVPSFLRKQLGKKATVKLDKSKGIIGLFPYEEEEGVKGLSLYSTASLTRVFEHIGFALIRDRKYEFDCEWKAKDKALHIRARTGNVIKD